MADEDKVLASLIMDRAPPLGNSLGPDGRRRLHVKVANNSLEPIPVFVTSGSAAMPHFLSTAGPVDTTPGTEQTLLSEVVAAPTARDYDKLFLTCRMDSWFKLTVDGTIIASGRTGPANPNVTFDWSPSYPVSPGATVEVKFTQRSGSPVSEVEAYLMATDT